MATTTRTPTTTTRNPYYRLDLTTGTLMTVDLLWIAKAMGHSVADTSDLQDRLAAGEVLENTLARFAKHAGALAEADKDMREATMTAGEAVAFLKVYALADSASTLTGADYVRAQHALYGVDTAPFWAEMIAGYGVEQALNSRAQ
jgi:hypothetical protein